MKKTIAAAVFALAAPTAFATPFYFDVGTDFGGDGSKSDYFDKLTYSYQSQTTFTDLDGSFDISVGDSILTTGGFDPTAGNLDSVNNNLVTSALPGFAVNDNGLGDDFTFTFTLNDLQGSVIDVDGGGTPGLSYDSGSVSIYYVDTSMTLGSDAIRLFDIVITGSYNDFNGLGVNGYIDNISAATLGDANIAAGDVFGFENYTFGEYLDAEIDFLFADLHQDNEAPDIVDFGFNDLGQLEIYAAGEHEGSMSFEVPEPGSLAVMGLGLLGIAGVARRRRRA